VAFVYDVTVRVDVLVAVAVVDVTAVEVRRVVFVFQTVLDT
jgi:hypothetical protein